jgi:hypothetical protein
MASVDFNIAGLVFILDHTDAAALVNAGPNIGQAPAALAEPMVRIQSLQGRVQCELPRTNFETKSAQTIPSPDRQCRLKGEGRDKRRASAQADRPFRASTCCKKRIEILRMPVSPSGRRFKCGPVAAARVRNTVSAAGNGMLPTDGTRRSGEMCKPDPTRQSVCASTLDGERGVMNSFRRKVRIDPSEAGTLPCT